MPHASDLIALKVLAATHARRGNARRRDVQDLVHLAPSAEDLVNALFWAASRHQADDFWAVRAAALLSDLYEAGAGPMIDEVHARLRGRGIDA